MMPRSLCTLSESRGSTTERHWFRPRAQTLSHSVNVPNEASALS